MENGNNRLRLAQEDVEEVKVIMLDNLNKAEERSGKLGELENRADQLLDQSKTFSKTSKKVKQKSRLKNMKMKLLLAAIVMVVVVAVVVVVCYISIGTESTPTEEINLTTVAPKRP